MGMDNYTETMRVAFREEATELLGELETSLLELEESPGDLELVDRVFRAMHTIKGTGGMFGFQEIAQFTHEVETVFDLVRNGKLPVTKPLIDLTLMARDQIRLMLELPEGAAANLKTTEIVTLLKKMTQGIVPGGGVAAAPGTAAAAKAAEGADRRREAAAPEPLVTYRIRFHPPKNIFLQGTDPILILIELRELGEARIVARTDAIPSLAEINPEWCYTYWDIILTTSRGANAIQDVFIFIWEESQVKIDIVQDPEVAEKSAPDKRIGEILVERGDVTPENIQEVLKGKEPIGKLLVNAGLVSNEEMESALLEQQAIKAAKERRLKEELVSSIRVASEKLDSLMDLVGELVILQARLGQTATQVNYPELAQVSEELDRLTAELRDNTMSLRMVPIGTTFSRFRRLVRDLSGELGKDIELTTEGAETELDKTVIERLNDPLIHLIRNSIDHGIERPEEREKAGKSPTGVIHLSSSQSGAFVLISITDDGAGLNKEKILAKAKERGLIAADAELSERDTIQLIFAPGFSTVDQVTGLSGRGVGMDVVKKTIDALGGSVEVESEYGKKTTIVLKIPLTLAIIEGLLVSIGSRLFVIPLSTVEECVELKSEEATKSRGQTLINIRGSLLPYINLRSMFAVDGTPPSIQQVVVTRAEGRRVGFLVDMVIGSLQTVIKSLGRMYRNVDGLSGATILGDGTVALILDVLKLARRAESEERLQLQAQGG